MDLEVGHGQFCRVRRRPCWSLRLDDKLLKSDEGKGNEVLLSLTDLVKNRAILLGLLCVCSVVN